ncbi:MAG: HlyD family efflux transporter periplasmic adaptor subunit [Xylanivirga thermophila]|jgi:HlyD family secretion protein|uniref:HlyD family efflux transporter periplasmic adaptor subunit n=1 Tax=Xylanivirga thermophila TaxID=2496273 RepID=UPI0039F50A70
MKKRMEIKRVLIIAVAIIVLGTAVYLLFFTGRSKAKVSTNYQISELKTGDLTQSITGTGTIWPEGTVSIVAPFDFKILSVEVEAGQQIKAGDTIAKLDLDALDTEIMKLKEEISAIDDTIVKVKEKESSTETIKAPVSGRIKQIFAQTGDNVKSIISDNDAILVISTDGKMNVTIETSAVEEGDNVNVEVDGKTYSGVVANVSNGRAMITITDNGTAVGATATIYNGDGDKLGSGTLSINQPLKVTADAGTVSKIYVSENSRVYKGTSLLYLKNLPTSEEYETQIRNRLEKQNLLIAVQKMRESGKFTSEYNGIVNSISINDGMQVAANGEILSLYTGDVNTLTVSVDELDIKNVEKGQNAKITVDAIEDKTYNAKVQSISQVGEVNNGVTTYNVSLKVEGDEQLRIGMNATAEIIVEERKDVLLLPLEALQSTQGEQYVWLYTGTLPKDSGADPGKRTVVKTGLSNASYVEITDGLNSDDKVVIVRTKTTNTNRQQDKMMAPGMDMGNPPQMQGNFPQDKPKPDGTPLGGKPQRQGRD